MDKGAHFYKCDFQVLTPRDAQSNGGGAITDHHDFAFFPCKKGGAE